MNKYIDFRSDTVTKPTPAMRKAMAEVEVGGDICKENSTVINLQKRMASMLGKETSLFFPTGTMANLISVMGHCWERDSEVLLGDMSHIHLYEQGGVSQLSNIKVTTLKTKSDGTFDFEEILDKINSSNCSKNVLLCLENTHNRCGGAVLSLQYMEKIASLANCHKIKIHMDGARIFNASIKLGIPVSTLLKNCDSVSTCLSKGLGAPAGSVVVGNLDFIRRLEKLRKMIGGEIIKSSILAAAGLVAIETMVERLKIDHEHAFKIGKAIYDMKSKAVTVNMGSIETNMILIDINPSYLTADKFSMDLSKPIEDMPTVKMGVISPTRLRCVLHADINSDDVDKAITKIQKVIKEIEIF